MNRLITIFLVLGLLLASLPANVSAQPELPENEIENAAPAEEAEESGQQDAAPVVPEGLEKQTGLLRALDMLSGEINFDGKITRAEMAKLAAKMLAIDGLIFETSYYYDVPAESPYSGSINAATAWGLFSGYDDYFDPDGLLIYEQAVKIMVNACGFGVHAENAGGYPSGYLAIARQNNILDGVSLKGGEAVSWADAIRLAYNALNANAAVTSDIRPEVIRPVLERGVTILSLRHGIYKGKGKITGTQDAKMFGIGLVGSDKIRDGEVEIDNEIFTYSPEKLPQITELLGYRTEYYYREESRDSERFEIVYVYPLGKSETLTLKSFEVKEVYGFDSGELGRPYIKYIIEDTGMSKDEKANLDSELSLIVNNRQCPIITNADLMPDCGFIKLLDSDDDGLFDFASVTNYEVKIVDYVSIYDQCIYFKNDSTFTPIILNPRYESITYELKREGKEVNLRDLWEYDVIGIVKSERDGIPHMDIEVLSSKIEGVIDEIESDSIVISGKRYKVAPDFNIRDLKIGDSGKFCFDFADRLWFFEKDLERTYLYLLLDVCAANGGIVDRVQFKMLYDPNFTGKKVEIFDAAKSVMIKIGDGEARKYSSGAIIEALRLQQPTMVKKGSAGDQPGEERPFLRPIKYIRFNDAGEVNYIELPERAGAQGKRTYIGNGAYNEAYRGDGGIVNTVKMTYESKAYYIPDSGMDEDFTYSELQKIIFNNAYFTLPWGEFKENEDDTDIFAEAIFVFHYRSWSVPTLNPVNYDRPMIVRSVSKIIDDDGMYVYKINTLNLGGSFYYLTEPDSDADFDALKPGDVIFTALSGWIPEDAPSKIQVLQSGRIYKYSKKISLLTVDDSYYAQEESAFGKVKSIRADVRRNRLVVELDCGDDGYRSFDIFGEDTYLFERSKKEVSVATPAAIKSIENCGEENASEIFINIYNDNINMVAIVNN